MSNAVIDTLRLIAGSLQIPTIIILLLLILLTIIMLGGFIVELFTERRVLKVSIHHYNIVTRCMGETCINSCFLTEVS